MTNMALVGTYNFWNVNISGHDQQTQLQDIKDFILDVWDSDIDNSNGDYSLSIGILPDEVNYTVPQSELCDNCTLGTRRDKCHEWAKNKSWYSNFDVVHFIDYYGGDPGTYGNAIIGGADHNNRSALTDCFWDWENQMGSSFDQVKIEGVAAHETLHAYCAYHDDSGVKSSCNSTVMYSPAAGTSGCYDNCANPDEILKECTSCTRSAVRCFIDSNFSRSSCPDCY